MAGEHGFAMAIIFISIIYLKYLRRRRRRLREMCRLLILRSKRRRMEVFALLRAQRLNRHRRRKSSWAFPRPQFWFDHMVLRQHEENIWREHFRMSKQTFEYVCDLVGPELLKQDTVMRQSIPVRKRVAVALWRLATGNSYRTTGLTFGIGRCTAMNLRDEFCAALITRAREIIKFPCTEAETRRAIQGFADRSYFPQVVGAIDGSHIPIKAPQEHPNDYYNRKSFHSIVLQGIADAEGRFIHVSTGYAGSIHDARVLRISAVPEKVEDGDILHSPVRQIGNANVKPLLVADPAYRLTTWCMKPYPETAAMTRSQREFNKSLSAARVTIEQAFGMLKGRWRCLLTKLDESVEKVPDTILACCILHNICSSVGDPTEICPHDDGDGAAPPGHNINQEGARLRELIRQSIFP